MRKDDIKEELKSMFRFVNTYLSLSLIIMCLSNLGYWNNGILYVTILKLYVFYIISWIMFYKVWCIKLLDKISYLGKLFLFFPITLSLFYGMFEFYEYKLYDVIFSLVSYSVSYVLISYYKYKKYKEYMKSCQKIVNKIKEDNKDEE